MAAVAATDVMSDLSKAVSHHGVHLPRAWQNRLKDSHGFPEQMACPEFGLKTLQVRS
jgi:hypothetical protein